MKKVLSVLLAAAMVMGMSVASFAADYSWTVGGVNEIEEAVNEVIEFDGGVYVVRDGKATPYAAGTELSLKPGDDLYFHLLKKGTKEAYTGDMDADWSINIKGNEYVDGASIYTVPEKAADMPAWAPASFSAKAKLVKVAIVDDLDTTALTNTVKFKMYIADDDTDAITNKVSFEAKFANIGEKTVDFEWINDVDEAAIWKVAKDKKGTAIFDFENDAYVTVKMISEEKVVLNLSTAYDKAIDKEYNEYDADLSFYNFKGTKDTFTKTAELLIPADEDTFIYEIVDGELVEVEAEWVEEYKLEGTNKEYEGWLIETKELGYYVVADEELVVAEEEVEAEPEVEADKANPETGAADFVGAAVAMAVVSVAAAGALALKK